MAMKGTRITTRFRRSSNQCAAATRTRRCIWLAKMIHAGEDLGRFIARRIVIHAAEDVGILADPMALVLANAAFQAAEFIGWPEAQIPLAEAVIYIATRQQEQQCGEGDRSGGERMCARIRPLAVPEHLRDSRITAVRRDWVMARAMNTRMIIRSILWCRII